MIEHIFYRLRCPKCKKNFLNNDRVFLDEYNTLLHQSCYTLETLKIKDRGTYHKIISKYDFLSEIV